jgi:hypothetical protein
MASKGIQHLIVNSPYVEPKHHWLYPREKLTFSLESGRRADGYGRRARAQIRDRCSLAVLTNHFSFPHRPTIAARKNPGQSAPARCSADHATFNCST